MFNFWPWDTESRVKIKHNGKFIDYRLKPGETLVFDDLDTGEQQRKGDDMGKEQAKIFHSDRANRMFDEMKSHEANCLETMRLCFEADEHDRYERIRAIALSPDDQDQRARQMMQKCL